MLPFRNFRHGGGCYIIPNYRRIRVPGGTYFFTVNLLDRDSRLLTDRIGVLREAVRLFVHDEARPSTTIARRRGPWQFRVGVPLLWEGTMPVILIETQAGWIADPAVVIAAVHAGVQDALRVPDWDRTVRLIEHRPDHFPPPPGKGDRFTLVEVKMFAGRSIAAKRALYEGVVGRLAAVGVPRGDTMICLVEVPLDNMAVFGASPASEMDLGFAVAV